MPNLTSDQLAAIVAGQPIRQTWTIQAPLNAAHSSAINTVIDDGIWTDDGTPTHRVLDAGRRSHEVWNPHPKVNVSPKAVRYAIEVDNADGFFHRRSGSVWNPTGVYDSAPGECYLIHNLSVLLLSGSWSAIPHMAFFGGIMNVAYSGGSQINRSEVTPGVTEPTRAPRTAVITSEQVGAWATLRYVFGKDDAVDANVMDSLSVIASFTAL